MFLLPNEYMTKELFTDQKLKQTELVTSQELVIDRLLAEFHNSVDLVARNPEKYAQMINILKTYNPSFRPVQVETNFPKAEVLANVVAGIYAPLIHGYATTIVRNIKEGKLPNVVIAPPRDAIPLAIVIQTHADIQGVEVQLLEPHINRNTAGIANNQKDYFVEKSPYLDLLLDQTIQNMNGSTGAVEVEPGVYGTTSLIMAEAFKSRKLSNYFPIKFYGLGPNLSYVHAILSGGEEWVAENAETQGLVKSLQVFELMVLLDTMEELGMEKFYESVEQLQVSKDGIVCPVIVPVSTEETEIAQVTNEVVSKTASQYANITSSEVKLLLDKVPWLVTNSQEGLPFTLVAPIPPMDSKEEHFTAIRNSKLFNYPNLML